MYIENTYSNKALIPFWVAHLFFLFLLILVLAVEMMELAGDIGYEPPALSAFMFFFCIALILEPLEMVLQSYRYLEPWLFLSFQIYKSLVSTSFFIYAIHTWNQWAHLVVGIWRWVWILILAFCACTAVSYYASLVYGAIVFRRHRTSKSDWSHFEGRSSNGSKDR